MRRLLLVVLALMVVFGPPLIWANYRAFHFRNFRVVEPDQFLRSGQLSPHGLNRIWYEHGIGTIVCLREDDELKGLSDDRWEERYCKRQNIVFVRLPPQRWHGKNKGPIPAQANVDRFLEVLRDPEKYPRPILLHCFKGTHRTGVFVALYRMEVDRWSNERAIAELLEMGYDNLEDEEDVFEYLQSYVPTWKR